MTEGRRSPPGDVAIEAIHFGDLRMPAGYVYRSGGGPASRLLKGLRAGADAIEAPCLAFVIRHPDGVILVDSGLHPDAHTNLGSDFGWPMRVLFKSLRPVGPAFDEQLRAREIEPESIATVVMTHLHVDHTSALRLLPDAELVCTPQEWEAAHRPLAAVNGYVASHLPAEERVRLVDLASDGVPHGPLARTHDLLGDGRVRLIWTPGHTPGHLSVLVSTSRQGEILLVGDAAYSLRNIDEDLLPMLTADDAASRRSMAELRALAAGANPPALVPSHDPEAWRMLAD